MHKIIIDTNVIVSALIKPGFPSKILTELVFPKKVNTFVSSIIFKEYIQVLSRPKFSKMPGFIKNSEIVLSRLDEVAIKKEPTKRISILKDEPDNRFLELAQEANADYLITGNARDFNIDQYGNTHIVSPSVYWNKLRTIQ